jgi:uroporphyrinogen-III synthase
MSGPLDGRVILVTRPREQAEQFAARLRDLGAHAIAAPTIELEDPEPGGPLDDAIAEAAAGRFRWVVFTSASGVRVWVERAAALEVGHPDARVAVVGDSTAGALGQHGIEVDLVPDPFTTAALGAAFPRGKGRVLLARADIATEELEAALRAKGWEPVRVDAYRVHAATAVSEEARSALEQQTVDAVVFTSPSTVEGYLSIAVAARRPPAVCIGPVTASAAERVGFQVAAVAQPHTEDGLIEALVTMFRTDAA